MKTKFLRFLSLKMFLMMTLILIAGAGYARALEVTTVPWVPSNPNFPHDTYNGVSTRFMAIARGGSGTYSYEWDFNGDGTYDYSNTTSNPYDLSTTHTYPFQASDRLFIARIRVTSGTEAATAEYRVIVHEPETLEVRVNRAIDNALWYLHTNMIRTTYDGVDIGYYPALSLGAAGMAAQAWAIQGHKINGNYDSNPYVEDVRRTLNACLLLTYTLPISSQPAGDPDTNGNGIGLYSSLQSQMYETGIVLMALANSGDPEMEADAGLPNTDVAGWSIRKIVQDMTDFLAYGQNEASSFRGGWRYEPNFTSSDMSVTQWPVIGLEASEFNPDFHDLIDVPGWVKTELRDYFLIWDQAADGGFGYTYPIASNVPRTGAGLACHAWVGLPVGDARVQAAINFLNSAWGWTGYDGNLGNFYSMYAVNKGMRGFEPDIEMIGTHDWYTEYANWLISEQAGDGGWTDCCWFNESRDLTTAAGVLILVKEVIQPPPVALADAQPKEAPPGAIITFDHSGSYHLDPNGILASFRWDLDDDGTWDYEASDINDKPTWVYHDEIGCGDEVLHSVTLEVVDGHGLTDQDTQSVTIKINLNNHPPVAIGDPTPSGPNYEVSQGGTVCLDASASYDPDTNAPLKCDASAPDDSIVIWEWDIDNNGLYDASGEVYCFDTPDTWEIGDTHTVQLRVTDDGSWAGPDGGGSKSAESTVTILVVPNQPPVADPKGPYLSPLSNCFDGTGSSDPDGDLLSYMWTFGDETTGPGDTPCHTYAEAGIYDVCLTVNDGTVDSPQVCTFAVIYDPSGGFVTGGGWIDSPAGAYKPDLSLTGKANFGFVSKYKKGADTPTGNTEFQFQAADLNFHSDSYQWLVVAGNNYARFKGSGTINGIGDYKFMLWAGDGEPDTFRIRIWEEDEITAIETDVYDNITDQAIGGGSIEVHTK